MTTLSASKAALGIRNRKISLVELIEACLDRTERCNGEANAFITVLVDHTREAALATELSLVTNQPLGPLHGASFAIKDLLHFKQGVRNAFRSVPLSEFITDRTRLHIERLEQTGALTPWSRPFPLDKRLTGLPAISQMVISVALMCH